jgi:hypothetical protein
VALHLAGQGDHRALITLVETWAELALPTVPARLAEARSFVSLRMVDRAWVRLKDLVECPEPHIEALQIAAQMFLLRGWQNQARRVVQVGLQQVPEDPLLEALAVQAAEAPPRVEDVLDEGAMSAEMVRVAEQHMARGAFVRARTLLERVRRREPGHHRTGELLWAIRGEFASTESLASMCERWAPPMATDAPVDDGFEEPEHTVSARVEDLRAVPEDRAFPQLFRHLEDDAEGDATDEGEPNASGAPGVSSGPEVTAVRSLADTAELDVSFPDLTDHGEDTQIARVMRKGGILQPIDTMHTSRPTPETGFNLAEYRRQMGVGGLSSDLQGPEDEDDSLVIRTGREAEPDTSETGHDLSLDTRDERLAKARQGSAEEEWAAPPTEVMARPRILGRPEPKRQSPSRAPRRSEPARSERPVQSGKPEPPPLPSTPNPPTPNPGPSSGGPVPPSGAASRADEEPTSRLPPVSHVPEPAAPVQYTDPDPQAVPGLDTPVLTEEMDLQQPQEYDEGDGMDDPYDPWASHPPPIAWPYWFFGLTAILAVFMMVFFLLVVASALL